MDVSDAWYKTEDLYLYFLRSQYVKMEIVFYYQELSMIANQGNLKQGDVMFFSEKADGHMNHVTIITSVVGGNIYYAAHTNPRWNMSVDKFFQGSPKGCIHVLSL